MAKMASSAPRGGILASFPRRGRQKMRLCCTHAGKSAAETDRPMLVVVESPSKANVLQAMLPKAWRVVATRGHVRDLRPKKGSVDPSRGFAMLWEERENARQLRKTIEQAGKDGLQLRLATDPDREGEAIAWHVAELVPNSAEGPNRCAFAQITADAVAKAMENPRPIDMNLVEAALARRALDFLVGFEVSPRMWRKLGSRSNSAGRVQSVALGLLEQRQREAEAFVPTEYHQVWLDVSTRQRPETQEKLDKSDARILRVLLVSVNGQPLGRYGLKSLDLTSKVAARAAVIAGQEGLVVTQRRTKRKTRAPPPPLNTAALQVSASQQLGMRVSTAMSVAQRLYEGHALNAGTGLITYMRTDSTRISPEALQMLREVAAKEFGKSTVPATPRQGNRKSGAKKIQDAHEAIRPTNPMLTPEMLRERHSIESIDDKRAADLYELIWKRAVAAQMENADLEVDEVELGGKDMEGLLTFRASSQRVVLPGWMCCMGKQQEIRPLPPLEEGDVVWPLVQSDEASLQGGTWQALSPDIRQQIRNTLSVVAGLESTGIQSEEDNHPPEEETEGMRKLPATTTNPSNCTYLHISHHKSLAPSKFTEARLVQTMEELGVGRPSTYAPTLSALRDRKYIEREGGARSPLLLTTPGRVASAYLSLYFSSYCRSEFTAQVEAMLDDIAGGSANRLQTLEGFWSQLSTDLEAADGIAVTDVVDHIDDTLGSHLFRSAVVQADAAKQRERLLLGDSNSVESEYVIPRTVHTITAEEERQARTCPACKTGRLGFKPSSKSGGFIGCSNFPECTVQMPLRVPDLDALGRGEYVSADSLGEYLGEDPLTGRVVRLKEGRYGAYLELELPDNEETGSKLPFVEEAKSKKGVQQKPPRSSVPPCFAEDPVCNKGVPLRLALALLRLPFHVGDRPSDNAPIYLRCGRFGPYLSDGEKFASVPKETWREALIALASEPLCSQEKDSSFGMSLDEAVRVLDEKGKVPRKTRFKASGKGKATQKRIASAKRNTSKSTSTKKGKQQAKNMVEEKPKLLRRVSAYNVFVSEKCAAGLKLVEVAQQWKEMQEEDKRVLQERADTLNSFTHPPS